MADQVIKGGRSQLWIILMALTLAFAFMGSRGIWDPDEGRYTNVAINMLESGDWVNPHRNADTGHWTKPPLTYWAVASSVGVFGLKPWAARLPVALSYLFCAWLVWRMSRRIAPEAAPQASAIYLTMLLPFAAANIVTTDYLLAACETLAMSCFVEARWGARHPSRWIALMWLGFALAFLVKGPPGLVPLLPLLLCDALLPGQRRALQLSGMLLFAILALPWYVAVVVENPGLLNYFVGHEVVARITTDDFRRNGEWYGWLVVYAPTLLLGTIPWTFEFLQWARGLPAACRRWRDADARRSEGAQLLLSAWVLIPLVVFCIARSRLPLYLLPLFTPLAILTAIQRTKRGRSLPALRWLLLWAVLLVVLRFAGAHLESEKNATQWAAAIRERLHGPVNQVAFVEDMARYSLRLHLDAQIKRITLRSIVPGQQPRFNPVYDEDVATELRESGSDPERVWVCKEADWDRVRSRIASLGYEATPLGTPYHHRVIFQTRPRGTIVSTRVSTSVGHGRSAASGLGPP